MFAEPWRIDLLGHLSAQQAGRVITRFQTQKTASLFAYLAYFQNRHHPRESLVDLLWPEAAPEAGRMSLRAALASLRRQLEPPGVPAGSVLIANRAHVWLNPTSVCVDVHQFQQALQAAAKCASEAQVEPFIAAVEFYKGDLLPGFYEEWVLSEREHQADAYLSALRQLTRLLAQARDYHRALQYARRAVSADPLREEAHRSLMRLYVAVGRPAAALQQFADMERILREKLDTAPSDTTLALVKELQASVPHGVSERAIRGESERFEERPARVSIAKPAPTAPVTPQVPLQFTRFFGREIEIERLRDLLLPGVSTGRLVTLTGPGGTGKSRLAIEIAGRLQEALANAVWFVPLADLAEARLIGGAILEALRLEASPETDPLEQIIAFLQGQPSLLILDNFEQLVDRGAAVVKTLLSRAPQLTCLVTSRQRLEIEGEREFALSPLPAPTEAATPEQLLLWPSVALFLDRAQAHRQDFQLTPRNATTVAALCQRLEGIPLAIELTAAWAQTLTPGQMLERLEHPFTLLVSRRKDMEERHRTLYAAIEWSYQMLPPDLQTFFARLSVFRGGWTAEAAEAVCADSHALNSLLQLRGRSLLQTEEVNGEMRYRMLETLREFAYEHLSEEDRAESAQRHSAYFLTLAQEVETNLRRSDETTWLQRLEPERENLRTAFAWCRTAEGNVEMGLRAAAALWRFWLVRGPAREEREQLENLLGQAGDSLAPSLRAQVLRVAGILADVQGDLVAARTFCEQSLALYRTLEDEQGIAVQLNNLAVLTDQQGDYEHARTLCEEALSLLRRTADRAGIARTLTNLGVITRHQGDYGRARSYYTESLAMYRELADYPRVSIVLHNLGVVASDMGDSAQACALLEESVALKRQLGDRRGIANSLGPLALLAFKKEDYALAHSLYLESLRLFHDLQDDAGSLRCLDGLAETLIQLGRPEQAARLLGVIEAQGGTSAMTWSPQEQSELAHAIAAARSALGAERFEAATAQAHALTLEQAIAERLTDSET